MVDVSPSFRFLKLMPTRRGQAPVLKDKFFIILYLNILAILSSRTSRPY